MLNLAAFFLAVTAVLAYVNHRFFHLPLAIGVMAIALLLSLASIGLDFVGIALPRRYEASLLRQINFSELLMQGMLSILLFAGALHIDLSELRAYRWQVAMLAFIGTTISALVIGFSIWYALSYSSVRLSLSCCLVFGALISPTDPIAVLGILRSAGAPKNVEVVISGESLFNDGVGIVLFSLFSAMAANGEFPGLQHVGMLMLREAGGGFLLGLAVGYGAYFLLKSIDSYQEEVLITLATVVSSYAVAIHFHVSGPLAMVVAGLIIGNHGRAYAMSATTRRHVDMFWELLDEILNALLFVLIGMELVLIEFFPHMLPIGLAIIAITLAARLLTVGAPVGIFSAIFRLPKNAWRVLTWGGLRGGISVALALSLPAGEERDLVVTLTYIVVAFSILIQGLTIGPVVRQCLSRRP